MTKERQVCSTEEALEELLDVVECAIKSGDWKVDGACDPDLAILSAKKALMSMSLRDGLQDGAQPKQHYGGQECLEAWRKDGSPIPAAQPEQEPNLNNIKFGGCPFCGSQSCVAGSCQQPKEPEQELVPLLEFYEYEWQGETHKVYRWLVDTATIPSGTKLYTTPPQRTWAGLTDEERKAISEANNMLVDDDLFDEIEAKLKAKNFS